MFLTVTPAYGRDYRTAKDARASWRGGDDWLVAQYGHAYDGKPCSVRDFTDGTTVTLRFHRLTKTAAA